MSEQVTESTEAEAPQEDAKADETTDSKTFDAEYVEKLRKEAAKYRTEAKANADAAKRLADIEESKKSEVEKAAEKAAAAEAERDAARAEVIRFRVAAKYGISDEDADLFLTGTDEESLVRQAERLSDRNAEASAPRAPRPDANQGRSGANGPKSTADSFAEFFRNNLPER